MSSFIDLPRPVLRGLHSAYVDYLATLPEPIRDAMLRRIGGLDFVRFILGLHAKMLLIAAAVMDDGESVRIGIAVPSRGRYDELLFAVDGTDVGVDAAHVVAAGELRIEEELAAILGGDQ